MNKLTILAATAPLALLAACGDDVDDVEAPDTETATTMSTDTAADTATSENMVATRLDDASDASGTYTYTGADGSANELTVDTTAGTYSYRTTDGTERTGQYERSHDGYRFLVGDYNGGPAYFTFSNGELVRLSANRPITSEMVVEGERYTRSDKPFSREPEIGSPVVPDDMTEE